MSVTTLAEMFMETVRNHGEKTSLMEKVDGRGAGDMKGGNACLITSFCLIKEMELDLPGKVTLTLVSDEENGNE